MFRAIVETQWKWTRGVALIATLLAFTAPLMSLMSARNATTAWRFVDTMQNAGWIYSVISAGLGLGVAVLAWAQDHRGRHVYALALPVPRWRYALMRFGAGALFLTPAVAGLLIGAQIVAFSGAVPLGLTAYPMLLTLRFALAALVAYAIFFAISSSTQRTAGIILGTIAAVIMVQYAIDVSGSQSNVLENTFNRLMDSGGILSIFTGRWSLIDA